MCLASAVGFSWLLVCLCWIFTDVITALISTVLQVVHVSDTVGVWGDGGVTDSGGMYVCAVALVCIGVWWPGQKLNLRGVWCSSGLVSLWCGAPCVLLLVCHCRCATSGYACEPQHAVLKDACQCAQHAIIMGRCEHFGVWQWPCCFFLSMGCPPRSSLQSVLLCKKVSSRACTWCVSFAGLLVEAAEGVAVPHAPSG